MRPLPRPFRLLPLALLLCVSPPSSAATFYWATARCTSLTFAFTANCWTLTEGSSTLSAVPPSDAGNSLSIRNSGEHALNVSYTAASGQRNYTWLVLDTPGTGSMTFSMSGGSLAFSSRSSIGQSGGGRFRIRAGSASFSDLTMGVASEASGAQLLLSETGLVVADSLQVGQRGEARVQLSDDSGLSVRGLMALGSLAGGRGSLQVDGGLLTVAELRVGDAGQGSVLQTGGTVNAGSLSLAASAGAQGAYALNGGRLVVSGDLLSPNGTGTLSLNGGELVVSGQTQLARFEIGNQGSFALVAGRTLTAQQSLLVDGRLQLAGGSLDGSGTMDSSGSVSGFGTVGGSLLWTATGQTTVSGGRLVLANGDRTRNNGLWTMGSGGVLDIASGTVLRNTGQFLLNGASVVGSGQLVNANGGVMQGPGTVQTFLINSGSLVLDAGQLRLAQGLANSGDLQLLSATAQLHGAAIGNGGLIVGRGRINNTVLNDGGRVQAQGGVLVLAGGVATAGGILAADDGATLRLSGAPLNNQGRIELGGGTLDASGLTVTNTGTVTGAGVWRSGAVAQQGQILIGSGLTEWHAPLNAAAGSRLIVSGLSRLVMHGALDLQSGAELRVSEGSAATFFGDVALRNGAFVTGSGLKFFEAGLSVGNSPATLAAEGDLGLGSSAEYLAELGLEGHDHLAVQGSLQLDGVLRVVALPGLSFAAGQRFDLFDWGRMSGQFAQLDFSAAALPAGLRWDSSRLYVDGSLTVAAVPEPSAAAMLLAGLLAVSATAARRRQRQP